jgi:hypothetical protein
VTVQRPPDYDGMIHLLLFAGPLLAGLTMAVGGGHAVDCVLTTWLTFVVMFTALATHRP